MTKRPAADRRNSHRRNREAARDFGTFVALTMLLIVAAGLIAIVAAIFNVVALWLVEIFLGFVLLGLVQYLTWGRWLSRNLAEEDEEG